MFSGIKDSLASSAAKSLLASRIERYGKIAALRINSRERSISAELDLEGEETPVLIEIGHYRIIGKSGAHALVVESVSASRPWLCNLLEDLLLDRPIPVPSMALVALGSAEEEPATA